MNSFKSFKLFNRLRSVQAPLIPRDAGEELGDRTSGTDGAKAMERNEVIEPSKAVERFERKS